MRYHVNKCFAALLAILMALSALPAGAASDSDRQIVGSFNLLENLRDSVGQVLTSSPVDLEVGAAALLLYQDTKENRVCKSEGRAIITVSEGVAVGAAIDPSSPLVRYGDSANLGLYALGDQPEQRLADSAEVAYLKVNERLQIQLYNRNGGELRPDDVYLITASQDPGKASLAIGEVKAYYHVTDGKTTYTQAGSQYKVNASAQPGDVIALSSLAADGEFLLFPSEQSPNSGGEPTVCQYVRFAQGEGGDFLVPCDQAGNALDGHLYKVSDKVYAFTVQAQVVPQEYANDNGDVWLWKGNEYYVNFRTRYTYIDYASAPRHYTDHYERIINPWHTSTITVSGHIGDTLTPRQLGGLPLDALYASSGEFVSGGNRKWVMLGNENRANFWITDYLQVNARENNITYFSIVEDGDGGVSLRANCGKEANAFVVGQTDMRIYVPMLNKIHYADNVQHIKISLDDSFSVPIDGAMASGTLQFEGGQVAIDYNYYNERFSGTYGLGTPTSQGNGVYSYRVDFQQQIPPGPAILADRVKLTIQLKVSGELRDAGGTMVKQYKGEWLPPITLTSGQLLAGYLACPTRTGYDVALDIGGIILNQDKGTRDLLITKVWNDADNAYQIRPDKVSVTLKRKLADAGDNGWRELDTVYTVKGAMDENVWKLPVVGLDKYDGNNDPYVYAIAREIDVSPDYQPTYDDLTVTNTLTAKGTFTLSGQVLWRDFGDAKLRGDKVTLRLYRDGIGYLASQDISKDDDWTYKFQGLSMFNEATGQPYHYQVRETVDIPGYYATYSKLTPDGQGNYTANITNALKTEIRVSKQWIDGDNAYATRPAQLKVSAMNGGREVASALLSQGNDWTYVFRELPKFDQAGNVIDYTVKEDTSWNGDGAYDCSNATVTPTPNPAGAPWEYVARFVGTYLPTQCHITATKLWQDEAGNPTNPPEGVDRVGVELFRRVGEGDWETTNNRMYLQSSSGWSKTWPNYPIFDEDKEKGKVVGKTPITYKLVEVEVPGGYASAVNQPNLVDGTLAFTVTNRKQSTGALTIEKLLKDGEATGSERFAFTVTGGGTTKTATISVAQGGDGYWRGSATLSNLAPGAYTVSESPNGAYASTCDAPGGRVEVAAAATAQITFTNVRTGKTDVSGTKTWIDGGKRHDNREELTIRLYRDGVAMKGVKPTWDGSKYTFANLDKYDPDTGKPYAYWVEEADVDGYTTRQSGNDFTNIIAQDSVRVAVTKDWVAPQDKRVPVKVELLRNGASFSPAKVVTLGGGNGLSHTFEGLDKYALEAGEDGREITYSVVEKTDLRAIDQAYEAPHVAGDQQVGFTITNAYPVSPTKALASVTGRGDENGVYVGDQLTYAIGYTNHKASPGQVTIVDRLDQGVDLVSAHGGRYDPVAHAVTWEIDGAPAFASGAVTVTVRVNSKAVDGSLSVDNRAAVQIGNGEMDTNLVTTPVMAPALRVQKAVTAVDGAAYAPGDAVRAGQRIEYSIVVANGGAGDAFGVAVTDALPANGVLDQASVRPAGSLELGALTWTVDIPAGGQAIFTYVVAAGAHVQTGDDLVNAVTVADPTNPDSPLTQQVRVPVNNPTFSVTKVWQLADGAAPVPAQDFFDDDVAIVGARNEALTDGDYRLVQADGYTRTYELTNPALSLEDVAVLEKDGTGQLAGEGQVVILGGWPYQVRYGRAQGEGGVLGFVITNQVQPVVFTMEWGEDGAPAGIDQVRLQLDEAGQTLTLTKDEWRAQAYIPVADAEGNPIAYTLTELGEDDVPAGHGGQVKLGGLYYKVAIADDGPLAYAIANTRAPGLSVDKRIDLVNGEPVPSGYRGRYGDVLTYQVTVDNGGDVTLEGISLIDSLPGISAIIGADGTDPAGFALSPGQQAGFTYTYRVGEEDILRGNIQNLATVQAPGAAPVEGSADVQTEQLNTGLTVTKTSDVKEGDTAPLDQTITYAIAVTNAGNVSYPQVVVTEQLEGATIQPGAGYTVNGEGNAVIDLLGVGQTVSIGATYRVAAKDIEAGHVRNTVEVWGAPVNANKAARTANAPQGQANHEDPTDQRRAYTIEYYYGGALDQGATVAGEANYAAPIRIDGDQVAVGDQIHPGAPKAGYAFDKAELPDPAAIQVEEGRNAIRVYYHPLAQAVSGAKTWVDGGDIGGTRPQSIAVELVDGQGNVVDTATASAPNWAYSFEGLDYFATYSVREVPVGGYLSQVSGSDIANILGGNPTDLARPDPKVLDPILTEVIGINVWNDANPGARPAQVTIALYANGTDTGLRTAATAKDGWTWRFTGLNQYAGGAQVRYTVAEVDVPQGYGSAVNGYTITNSALPYTLTVRYWYGRVDGQQAYQTFARTYAYGEYYSVRSPQGSGWAPDKARVAGDMPAGDVVVDVVYARKPDNPADPNNPDAPVEPIAPDGGNRMDPNAPFDPNGPYAIDPGMFIVEYGVPLGIGAVVMNAGDCFE